MGPEKNLANCLCPCYLPIMILLWTEVAILSCVCSVVVGGDKERVADSDDEEDDEMTIEEGAKAFSNDWLPPKQPPKQTSGCVTDLRPLCA